MTASFAEVPPADKDAMRDVSELVNSKLTLFPDPNTRTWYKLFHYIDHRGSGRISWYEPAPVPVPINLPLPLTQPRPPTRYEFKAFIRTTLEISQARQ